MPRYLLICAALILGACNLTAPGSPADIATATSGTIQSTSDLSTPASAQGSSEAYTNTQHGYTLQRPTDVNLVEDGDNDRVWIDDQIEIYVTDVNPEEARGDGAPLTTGASDTKIGSYPARRLTGSVGSVGGGTPQNLEQVIIAHNGRYYVFTVYELKRSAWTGSISRTMGAVPASEVDLLNNILATLRFTE